MSRLPRLTAFALSIALLAAPGADAEAQTALSELKPSLAGRAIDPQAPERGDALGAIRNSPFVVLRAEPRLQSAAVATLGVEDRLLVVGRQNDWVKVVSTKGAGWMRTWYLQEPRADSSSSVSAVPASAGAASPAPPASTAATPDAVTGGNFTPPTGLFAPPAAPARPPAVPPAAPAPPAPAGSLKGARVLLIGDSHSVGVYGSELDLLLRRAGAVVRSVGVSGSSPSWWWSGTVTKSGYVDRRPDGTKDQPADWRTPRATPAFAKLLAEHKPDLVVISLGANMLGASAKKIEADCGRLVDMARDTGARVAWVGPPDARAASTNDARAKFYETLESALAGKVSPIVDARRFTKYPASGGDGVHYWGTEGTAQAKTWARGVFEALGGGRD